MPLTHVKQGTIAESLAFPDAPPKNGPSAGEGEAEPRLALPPRGALPRR